MKEPQEIPVWALDGEVPLEEEIATHSCILSWKIPWTEEPCRLQSMGSQRVRHDWMWVSWWWWWWWNNVTITIILLPMGKLRLRKTKVARSNFKSFGEFIWTLACIYTSVYITLRYTSRIYICVYMYLVSSHWTEIESQNLSKNTNLLAHQLGFPGGSDGN